MHCWKTINVQKQYGYDRIFILSSLLFIIVFSIVYVALDVLRKEPLSDRLFAFFLCSFLMVYPIHKLLHFLPLIRFRKRLKFSIEKQFGFLPILFMRIHEPIPKNKYVFALMSPFLFLNISLVIGAILFPAFGHYFAILLAYHCGLCLIDLLYVKNLMRSPKKALIEETEKGYEILVPPSS